MATQTNNLKLTKPELTDSPPDITQLNQNWDKLDSEVSALKTSDIDCGTF